MQVKAKANYVRIAPRKARLVIAVVRGLDIEKAIETVKFVDKKASKPIMKLLQSALANAENNFSLDRNNLFIETITVDEGPVYKRWMPRAFGRATMIRKKTSNINVVLAEKNPTVKTDKVREEGSLSKDKINKAVKKEEMVPAVEQKVSPATASEEPQKIVDIREQGKHRHAQNLDTKNKKDKGFLKKVFRRKSGE